MRLIPAGLLLCGLLTGALSAQDHGSSERDSFWHHWRGPLGTGVAPEANPPLTWSEQENIRWKVEIPGRGNASPIIWKDRVYVVSAVPTGRIDPDRQKPEDQPERQFGIKYPNEYYRFVVLCLDRQTGKTIWERVATEAVPHEGHHPDNSFASGSPTTDGQRLYVWFGSQGLFCYDLDGNLLWKRDLGPVTTRLSFNEGSSPTVHGDTVVIVRDQEEQSYIIALDADTGATRWKVDRDEPSTWATPVIVEHDGRVQVITNGSTRVRSYDLRDGSLIWECGGQVANVTPSPVVLNDQVLCMSGYRGYAGYAIPIGLEGDLTDSSEVAWKIDRGTPYIPSPLLYDGLVYFNQQLSGIWSCANAETGEFLVERERLPGIRNLYASPLGAAGRVYVVGRDGTTVVLKHGPQLEVLATNQLDDNIDASPAAAGSQLFLRGKRFLYCISE